MGECQTLAQAIGGKSHVIGGPFGSKLTQSDYVKNGLPVVRGSNMEFAGRWVGGEYAFVSPEKVARDLSSNLACPGDLVVTQRGTMGQVSILPLNGQFEHYVISQSQMALHVTEPYANRDFVYYYLKSPEFAEYIQVTTIQTGVPHINLGILRDTPVVWPNLPEQYAIASILGALDDKIDLNRRMNETLEAMARAIFKDWFMDFGPVRAKVEGRPPYLSPEIWELFPDALDDDDKPVGWRIGHLQSLVELNPKEPLPQGSIAPYLEMAALPTTGSTPEPYIERQFSSGTRFRNGDTLLARITPCLENGKTAFVQDLPSDAVGWGSTEFIVLRPIPPVPKPYAYILAREASFRTHAIQSMTGTSGRQRARSEALAEYPVAIPNNTDAIWQAFGLVIEPMFERIRISGKESQTLAQLRDLLLPKLMSGEIRLRDAEKMVEAVA